MNPTSVHTMKFMLKERATKYFDKKPYFSRETLHGRLSFTKLVLSAYHICIHIHDRNEENLCSIETNMWQFSGRVLDWTDKTQRVRTSHLMLNSSERWLYESSPFLFSPHNSTEHWQFISGQVSIARKSSSLPKVLLFHR